MTAGSKCIISKTLWRFYSSPSKPIDPKLQ